MKYNNISNLSIKDSILEELLNHPTLNATIIKGNKE